MINDSIAESYALIGNYLKAQEHALKACSIFEKKNIGSHDSYLSALRKLSVYHIEDQELAVSWLKKARDVIEKYNERTMLFHIFIYWSIYQKSTQI